MRRSRGSSSFRGAPGPLICFLRRRWPTIGRGRPRFYAKFYRNGGVSRQHAALYPNWRDRISRRACHRDSLGRPVPQEGSGKGNHQRGGRGQAHPQRGHQKRREQKAGSPGRGQGENPDRKAPITREKSKNAGPNCRTTSAGSSRRKRPWSGRSKTSSARRNPTTPAWPTWRRPGPRSPSSRPSRWRP